MRIYGSIVYIPSMSWSPLICPMGSEYPETYTSAISPASSRAGGRAGGASRARAPPPLARHGRRRRRRHTPRLTHASDAWTTRAPHTRTDRPARHRAPQEQSGLRMHVD